jgi:hypothetical protein
VPSRSEPGDPPVDGIGNVCLCSANLRQLRSLALSQNASRQACMGNHTHRVGGGTLCTYLMRWRSVVSAPKRAWCVVVANMARWRGGCCRFGFWSEPTSPASVQNPILPTNASPDPQRCRTCRTGSLTESLSLPPTLRSRAAAPWLLTHPTCWLSPRAELDENFGVAKTNTTKMCALVHRPQHSGKTPFTHQLLLAHVHTPVKSFSLPLFVFVHQQGRRWSAATRRLGSEPPTQTPLHSQN